MIPSASVLLPWVATKMKLLNIAMSGKITQIRTPE
jgi:hypothetical protein